MITCEKCGSQFMADRNISLPGHCDPPGSFLAYSAVFGVVSALCATIAVFALRSVMLVLAGSFLVGAMISLSRIREARRVCEQSGGGVCPSCGYANKVTWYS